MTFTTSQSIPSLGPVRQATLKQAANANDQSPLIKTMRDYWEKRRQNGTQIPCICDIELMDIYEIASHLIIDDVDDDPTRYINRFWGGELTWRFSFEGTSKPVSEFRPTSLASTLQKRYRDVMKMKRPHWQKVTKITGQFNSDLPVEMLHLPLLGKQEDRIRHVLTVFDFSPTYCARQDLTVS